MIFADDMMFRMYRRYSFIVMLGCYRGECERSKSMQASKRTVLIYQVLISYCIFYFLLTPLLLIPTLKTHTVTQPQVRLFAVAEACGGFSARMITRHKVSRGGSCDANTVTQSFAFGKKGHLRPHYWKQAPEL